MTGRVGGHREPGRLVRVGGHGGVRGHGGPGLQGWRAGSVEAARAGWGGLGGPGRRAWWAGWSWEGRQERA